MIRFLNSTLKINLISNDFSLNKDAGAIKKAPREYEVFLQKGAKVSVIVHELWHIFFDALSEFDSGEKSCMELSKDIYAYSFEKMVDDTLNEWKELNE